MIEFSLIDHIPELGPILVLLIWLFWSGRTLSMRQEWQAIVPSCPVVTIVLYHAMEVSCCHFFWAVELRLCLRLVTLGSILVSASRYSVEVRRMWNLFALTFNSASQNCLRIHLDCLTAVKSNLFGLHKCLKGCRGGHQGELIHFLGFH